MSPALLPPTRRRFATSAAASAAGLGWVERSYRNLICFYQVDKGGHFAAWEQPELFSSEIRAAFRPLRA